MAGTVVIAAIRRRFGVVAAALGGGFYAPSYLAAYAERSVLLEPIATLSILFALLVLSRPALRGRLVWPVAAGVALGVACGFKIWYVVPAVIIVVAAGRSWWKLLVGAAVGGLAVYLPFFLVDPAATFGQVVADQLGRGQTAASARVEPPAGGGMTAHTGASGLSMRVSRSIGARKPTSLANVRMHADQREVDADLAARVVAAQFPQWADLPVSAVPGDGTVNAIFRIGDHLSARFPVTGTRDATFARLRAEAAAVDEFAMYSTVPAPGHVALGEPIAGFDLPWSVQTWLSGQCASPTSVAGSEPFALDLAGLLSVLRTADTRGRRFAGAGRGGELTSHDGWVDECILRSGSWYDPAALRRAWSALRALPRESRDAMTHGDLIPGNVLADNGRLVGVLDSGGFAASDPALDLVSAWHLLDAGARRVLREALDVGELEWLRGAAWAFEQAIGLIWYYDTSNPAMAHLGRTTLDRLLTAEEITQVTHR